METFTVALGGKAMQTFTIVDFRDLAVGDKFVSCQYLDGCTWQKHDQNNARKISVHEPLCHERVLNGEGICAFRQSERVTQSVNIS
jgi:hypothetical protein